MRNEVKKARDNMLRLCDFYTAAAFGLVSPVKLILISTGLPGEKRQKFKVDKPQK